MSRDHRHPGRSPRARAPSPYEILRVQPGASAVELRRAYRAAARNPHPDTNPSPDAAAQFAALHQAWRALTDPGSQTGRQHHRGSARLSSPAADRCPTDCGPRSAGVGDRHGCVERPVPQVARDCQPLPETARSHAPSGFTGRRPPTRVASAVGGCRRRARGQWLTTQACGSAFSAGSRSPWLSARWPPTPGACARPRRW